jgi:hypothetical protein
MLADAGRVAAESRFESSDAEDRSPVPIADA